MQLSTELNLAMTLKALHNRQLWRWFTLLIPVLLMTSAAPALAMQDEAVSNVIQAEAGGSLNLTEMLKAGGVLGYLIVLLSLVMVALIADHLLNIRRSVLMPPGLAEEIHRCLGERRIDEAKKICQQHPSFLASLLHAGLEETGGGYHAVEKAMEDAAVEQSARLFRRIEYLSVIGTLAPMLGLMGTVWGMILAFLQFEQKDNPQVSELAPGIYRALITTLLGLGVAVPSLAAFAIFRNRIDELAAEATLLAEHVFADYRRASQRRSRSGSESATGTRKADS
ncbi:MAG: MotA/TolQ/ExbB proton channel family protein [Planctomycetaceae bacterium]